MEAVVVQFVALTQNLFVGTEDNHITFQSPGKISSQDLLNMNQECYTVSVTWQCETVLLLSKEPCRLIVHLAVCIYIPTATSQNS
jgi:hypothetical protein